MHWLNSNKPSNPYIQEPCSQCLKIVQKSLIFTLRAMRLRATVTFKNAQNGQFSELLKIEATSVNSVTRPVCFNRTKIGRKCQSGLKFIKNAKNGQFWRVFDNLKLAVKQCYQTGHF